MMQRSLVALLTLAAFAGISVHAHATQARSKHGQGLKGRRSDTLHYATAKANKFGPNGCVSVDQSKQGSCIIRSNCEGRDLSNFEFAFDCLTESKGRNRHSFGIGSFDAVEDYDTGVVCDDCADPTVPLAIRGRAATKLTKAVPQKSNLQSSRTAWSSFAKKSRALGVTAPESLKDFYGPDKCISTFRNSTTGNCIMATSCLPTADLSHVEFGLLCVQPDNGLMCHLLGKNSFSSNETFDTLIECDYCFGMDRVSAANQTGMVKVAMPSIATVPANQMQKKMAEMDQKIVAMASEIAQLKKQVAANGAIGSTPASTTTPRAAAAAASATSAIPVAGLRIGWKRHEDSTTSTASLPRVAVRSSSVESVEEQSDNTDNAGTLDDILDETGYMG